MNLGPSWNEIFIATVPGSVLATLFVFSLFRACSKFFCDVRRLVTMPKKVHGKCFRDRQRQRQPEQVQAGLLYAYHQDCWDHACHVCISTRSAAAAARRTGAPNGGRWWAGADAYMTCMVPTVLMVRVEQLRLNLLRLPLSATKAFSTNLLRHRH